MLAERSRPRTRVAGPLAIALVLHGLALGAAAMLGFQVPARVEDVLDKLALALRPEEPLPAPEALAELEFIASDDIPELEAAPEPMPFDPLAYDLATLPEESVVTSAPLPLRPPEEIAPGAAALGLLSPTIAVTWASGGSAPAASAPPASIGSTRGTPGGTGIVPGGDGTGIPVVAAATRPVVVREPEPLATPAPAYPRLSSRAGEEGTVLCRLHISEAGKVTAVEVVESSGYERLDKAARETLLAWTFEPLRLDGRGVATTMVHRVTFRLEG